jgi:hypothetical protein
MCNLAEAGPSLKRSGYQVSKIPMDYLDKSVKFTNPVAFLVSDEGFGGHFVEGGRL